MYGPDSYLYELNLALLTTLSEEELADPMLVAQITVAASPLAGLVALVKAVADWFAPSDDPAVAAAAVWMFPPLY